MTLGRRSGLWRWRSSTTSSFLRMTPMAASTTRGAPSASESDG
jgi:hypothetical protein